MSVSALNRLARDLLERALPLMWIRGEISNFTCAASGHCYFTLKDAGAQVRCAMFRSRARLMNWQLQNGMQVEVRAVVTLFEARGEFQLSVESVRRAGTGSLHEAFERLKAKLGAEGLFDPERKRALPAHPRAIGIVTSPKAAALRDVLSILRRRMPAIPIVVYPTPVQGDGAGQAIADAVGMASARAECDVLVLCRGGGSIEDLWAFNEEVVARALAACALPVVSGVGHETDFTIADFVADLRAPTPSAAAEAVSPDCAVLRARVAAAATRLARSAARNIEARGQSLDFLARRLVHPGDRLRAEMRHLRHCLARLNHCAGKLIASRRWALGELAHRMKTAGPDPSRQLERIRQVALRLQAVEARQAQQRVSRLTAAGARLESLNPHAVLARGYAIATTSSGAIVHDASVLMPEQMLELRFGRGTAHTQVRSVDTSPAGGAADAAAATADRDPGARTR